MTKDEFWSLTDSGDFRAIEWENRVLDASGILSGVVFDDNTSGSHVRVANDIGAVRFVAYSYIVSVV